MLSLLFLVLILFASLIPSPSPAFHEGIETCKDGEMGYIAVMIAEEKGVFTFLSSQDPPSTEAIICKIDRGQLIQVKSSEQGL